MQGQTLVFKIGPYHFGMRLLKSIVDFEVPGEPGVAFAIETVSPTLEGPFLRIYSPGECEAHGSTLRGERLWHGPPLELANQVWEVVVAEEDLTVVRLELLLTPTTEREFIGAARAASAYCFEHLGEPRVFEPGRYTWDIPDGNVILGAKTLWEAFAVKLTLAEGLPAWPDALNMSPG